MGQATLPPIGAEMPTELHPALPAVGAEMPPELHPDFTTSNEKDAAGNATIDPEGLGTVIRHWWSGTNPAQVGQLLPFPKVAGGSGLDHPLGVNPNRGDYTGADRYAPNLAKDMHAVKREADRLWDKGDYVGASAKYVESIVPFFGPMMSHWGNNAQGHKWSALVGDAAAFATNLALPGILGKTTRAVTGAANDPALRSAVAGGRDALTPAEASSNAFAREHGVPLDAATATGSRFLRGVQKGVGESLAGAPIAEHAVARQHEALTRVSDRLAEEAQPGGAVSPEAAGTGVRDTITGLIRDLHKQASGEYEKLEAFEADPKYASVVPKTKSGAQLQAIAAEQQRSLGRVPTEAELQELRQIREELDAYGYEQHTIDHKGEWTPRGQGGTVAFVPGHGGAPVYNDIVGSMEGAPTRAALQGQIEHALETGNFRSEGAKNALEVAGRRLAGDTSLSRPILGGDAGAVRPRMETMGLAVDFRPAKQALRPLYDQLKREAELVPLMGDKARALTALDRMMNGPDHAPLSVADPVLSDLKAMARVNEPALRSVGQGKAAFAVSELEKAVRARASAAGPEVLEALELGRAATKGKWQTADVLDAVKGEPVEAFRQLTAPKDAHIGLLRRVGEVAPQQLQALGRAKLEEMFDLATERDRFDHVDKLYAEWQKLGPETKRLLFGQDLIPKLDDFFLLAKRIGENPNPSGTATTLTKVGEVIGLATHPFVTLPATLTSGALARLLYTPRGVAAVTRALEVELAPAVRQAMGKTPIVRGALREAARADLVLAAKRAGVPLEMPKAAKDQSQ